MKQRYGIKQFSSAFNYFTSSLLLSTWYQSIFFLFFWVDCKYSLFCTVVDVSPIAADVSIDLGVSGEPDMSNGSRGPLIDKLWVAPPVNGGDLVHFAFSEAGAVCFSIDHQDWSHVVLRSCLGFFLMFLRTTNVFHLRRCDLWQLGAKAVIGGAKRQVVLVMIANGRLYRIAPNGLSSQSRPNDRSFSSLSNKSFSEK